MAEDSNTQISKRCSLSSYLSKVKERREELQKLEKQTSVANKPTEQEPGAQSENKFVDQENDNAVVPKLGNDAVSCGQVSPQGNVDLHQVKTASATTPILDQNKEPKLSHPKDEELRHDSDFSKGKYINDGEVDEKSGASSERVEGIYEETENVDSDAPTAPATPLKIRRGRLVRGDQLNHIAAASSHSDSASSDIYDSQTEGSKGLRKDNKHVVRSSMKRNHPQQGRGAPKLTKQRKGMYRDSAGRTKLQVACDKGKYELAKKLIEEEKYDVNDQDNAGNTALHEAALNGHLDIVKLLVSNGAEVNIKSCEIFQDTPLVDASANGHLQIVKYLLSKGADPTISNSKGLTAYDSIEEDSDLDDHEKQIVKEIKHCLSEATLAWRISNPSSSQLGGNDIDNNYNSNSHDERMHTPGSTHSRYDDRSDMEFTWTDVSSKTGKDKLFRASREGKLSYVGSYLENGGRVDFKSFLEAIKSGHEDIASIYLAFGAPVNKMTKDHSTALMAAVGRGHIGTVKLLLEAGANPNKVDRSGHTALYYAEHVGPEGVVDAEEVALLKNAISDKIDDEKEAMQSNNKKRPVEHISGSKRDDDKKNSSDDRKPSVEPSGLPRLPSGTPELLEPTSEQLGRSESPVWKRRKPETPAPVVKPVEETPEAREARLKAEAEYFQRKLESKRKKEQELLQRLKKEADKRQEEKRILEEEAAQRAHEARIEEEKEIRRKELEQELERRRAIRSQYPLGLRLISSDDTANSRKRECLPIYYVRNRSGESRVLELQVRLALLKSGGVADDSALARSPAERESVKPGHRPLLWNVMKNIWMCGGEKVDWRGLSVQERLEIEAREYAKFARLPLYWVPWEAVKATHPEECEALAADMVELALPRDPVEPGAVAAPTAAAAVRATGLQLPPVLQYAVAAAGAAGRALIGPYW